MIAIIQRVSEASVSINGTVKSQISKGYLLLLGIMQGDTSDDCAFLARKTAGLRIFPDDAGKMNLSISDARGEILVISQFTLCADTEKGNRPSFVRAAPPEAAIPLYEEFILKLRACIGAERVHTGEFGADMKVALVNDGPVTIKLATKGA